VRRKRRFLLEGFTKCYSADRAVYFCQRVTLAVSSSHLVIRRERLLTVRIHAFSLGLEVNMQKRRSKKQLHAVTHCWPCSFRFIRRLRGICAVLDSSLVAMCRSVCSAYVSDVERTNERSVTSWADVHVRPLHSRCCETRRRDRVHDIASGRMLEPME
jgi:hypothetical protein